MQYFFRESQCFYKVCESCVSVTLYSDFIIILEYAALSMEALQQHVT